MDSLVVASKRLDCMSILMKKIVRAGPIRELLYIREPRTSMFTNDELQELIEYVCTT